ncbi:hypothetical protein JCM10449v2_007228 [Rhodotorula kratochvilovae]
MSMLVDHDYDAVRAVHRLYSSALTEEKNKLRYGLQAMAIHGHTYEFEVKFRGPAHRATGQIGGAGFLEDIMSLSIHEILHARNLDTDIPFFHSRPSTLENVCLTVWRNIGVIMAPHPYNVCEVSVECQPCPKPQGGQVITRSRVSFAGEMVAMPSP